MKELQETFVSNIRLNQFLIGTCGYINAEGIGLRSVADAVNCHSI